MANTLRAAQATQCDLFLVIGTSAVVHPAAGFIGQAKAADAFVVELNLEPTPPPRSSTSPCSGARRRSSTEWRPSSRPTRRRPEGDCDPRSRFQTAFGALTSG